MSGSARDAQRFSLSVAIGLFTIAFALLSAPWLLGNATIPYDAKSSFYPQFVFLARSLAEGQSPFWTPNIFAGWPQVADPQSLIFSPLHFLIALFDPAPGLRLADAVVFGLLYIGGMGVILYFRDRSWHLGGAIVAALAFAFGGSAASRIQHIGQLESLMYFPLTLLLLTRAIDRSSWRAGIGAGVFVALIVLGRNQVSLLLVYCLVGFVLWNLLSHPDLQARIRTGIKPLGAAVSTCAVIAAGPVLLTMMLASDSNRPEIEYSVARGGSLHPFDTLMLAFADVFGACDFNIEYWGSASMRWFYRFGPTDLFLSQNSGQIYVGALVMVSVLGLGAARGQLWARDIRFMTTAMVVMLLYALGKYTPAFYLIYEILPGVSFFRYPVDATFVFCALLSLIAGYLVHRLLTETLPPPRRWGYALLFGLAFIAILLAVWLAFAVGALQEAAIPILVGIAFAAGAIVVLYYARLLAGQNAVAAATLLAAFCVADLAWNNAPNEATGLPRRLFTALQPNTTNETVKLLKTKLAESEGPDRRDRVEMIGIAYHWPNIGLIHDFDHLFGHNPLRLSDFTRVTAAPDTVALPEHRRFTRLLPSYRSTLENLFGVRFIATGVPIEKIDPSLKPNDFKLIAHTKDAYVYENPDALPRVMLVTDWQTANFKEMIQSGNWPDIDPKRIVLLEHAPKGLAHGTGDGSARIVRYRNTEIDVETEAPTGGILVLNDVWHPWWRANVDDKSAEILKANVLFRAVVVPAGRHVVHFEFHPFTGAIVEMFSRKRS